MLIRRLLAVAIVLTVSLCALPPAEAYIEVPHSFGQVVAMSSNVVLMRVEAVDKEKNLIIYRKIRDVKGVHPTDVIKHNIGRGGLRPNEWKKPMDWAEPGKTAVFFYNGGASETCIGNWWYQAYAGGEWWNHSHGEPFLLRTYCGPPDRLPPIVTAVMEGKEVVAPCMVDGNKEDLHNHCAKIQRLKVSLKLANYDQKRDFVGWGGEEFRRLLGMPGFSHVTSLARTDPDAQAISVVDFDNDGKPDLCLVGGGKLVILQNGGETMSEVGVPGLNSARSALWADYNGDGLPDLLVVTSSGPRLYTNLGKAVLRDDSHLLPREPYYQCTAAAWADVDSDGKPDIVLANGYHGLRVYRNLGLKMATASGKYKLGPWSVLGPVDYNQQKGFEAPHPAEKLDLKGGYEGKGGLKIQWKQAKFVDGAVNDLLQHCPPQFRTWVGAYVHRTIEAEDDVSVPISLGSDDTLTVWLDGQKIVSSGEHRGCAPDQNFATLKLTKGKHDLLMKIGQGDGDFSFYFKAGDANIPVPLGKAFEDYTAQTGLTIDGPAAADVKFDSLVVQDVNGDGRPDFLYGNRLFLNLATNVLNERFVEVKDSGLDFEPTKAGGVFGDFDGDGVPDLFVPARSGSKLYKGDGKGHFVDVTAKAGLSNIGWATSAAWGDVDSDGRLDLIVGCLKSPNRYFRNRGDGTVEDATERIGLGQKIYNTQAVSLVDLNGDGQLDFVFNNEGQDSTILLGSASLNAGKRMPVTLRVQGKTGVTGSQVRVLDKAGKLLALQEVSGGDGRGSQQAPMLRFALEPGAYQVHVRLSNGEVKTRDLTVGDIPLRAAVGE